MSKNFFYYAIVCFALSWDAGEAANYTCTFHAVNIPKEADLKLVVMGHGTPEDELFFSGNEVKESKHCSSENLIIDWENKPGNYGNANCEYQMPGEHREYYINYLGKSKDGKYTFDCKAPAGKTKK